MAYPLIFFLLSLIPIAEKIYHSTSATPSYFLAISLATPSGGVFASMALYIHVCVMKKDSSCNKKKTQTIPVNEDGGGYLHVPSQTRPSTIATHFTIPLESTLDNAFITSKGGQP